MNKTGREESRELLSVPVELHRWPTSGDDKHITISYSTPLLDLQRPSCVESAEVMNVGNMSGSGL